MKVLQSLWLGAVVGCLVLPLCAPGQVVVMFDITDPIAGNMGEPLEIVCGAFTVSGGVKTYEQPANIGLMRNGLPYTNNRLTSSINDTHKTYTLQGLEQGDAGARISCAVAEHVSREVVIEVYYPPSISDLNGTTVTVTAGNPGTTIPVSIDANPDSVNTIEVVSTSNVPASISISGNSLVITNAGRSDSGMYDFVATNNAGSGRARFTLDVQYPPDFGPTISEEFECIGPVMDGLTSRWTCAAGVGMEGGFFCDFQSNPSGTLNTTLDIPDRTGVTVTNGMMITIATTGPGNAGTYTCRAINTIQGQERVAIREIRFFVGVAPGEPQNLTVDSIGATWANLCWQEPQQVGQPGIDFYTIYAQDMASGDNVTMSTYDNATRFNMTGLLPDVTYEFRVFAVAMALDVQNPSMPSEPATGTTTITVPAPVCNIASPDSGGIYINWMLIHTGGRPLTSLSVSYIFMQGSTNMTRNGPMVELSDVSASIPSLVAGYSYFPRVTAANVEGSTTVECPRVDLNVGIPQNPEEPQVVLLGGGRVAVTVRTLTSGLESGGSFYFILTLIRTNIASGDQDTEVIRRDIADYNSGDEFTFNLDLVVGDLYTFDVVAGNEFGMSGISSTSLSDTDSSTSIPDSSTSISIAVGVILPITILATVSVVILLTCLLVRSRRRKGNITIEPSHEYEDVSINLSNDRIELGTNECYQQNIILRANEAYAQVDTANT